MEVTFPNIYNLEHAVIASGFPMLTEYDIVKYANKKHDFFVDRMNGRLNQNADWQRACKLAANPAGTGHNNFLSGILVVANVTATQVFWLQMERYHFVQIVSSQSKMHRLRQMVREQNFSELCNRKTHFDPAIFDENMSDEEMAYSCPSGLELTAQISTNYLALKTIFFQRKNHKLKEWRDFCDFIRSLPQSELITNETAITAAEGKNADGQRD